MRKDYFAGHRKQEYRLAIHKKDAKPEASRFQRWLTLYRVVDPGDQPDAQIQLEGSAYVAYKLDEKDTRIPRSELAARFSALQAAMNMEKIVRQRRKKAKLKIISSLLIRLFYHPETQLSIGFIFGGRVNRNKFAQKGQGHGNGEDNSDEAND